MMAALWTVLLACSGGDDMMPEDTDEGRTTDSAGPAPRDPITGAEGYVVLGQAQSSAATLGYGYSDYSTYAFGVTFPDGGGYINLAHCLLLGSVCTDTYPASGAVYDTPFDGTRITSQNLDPGLIVAAGVEIPYDNQQGISVGDGIASGAGDLSIDGGDLVSYMGSAVFEVLAGGIDGVTPDPMVPVGVSELDTLTFAWKPGSSGNLFLSIGERIYGLDDSTGTFELPVADAGFPPVPISNSTVFLSRLTNTTVDAGGNTFHVESRVDQPFVIEYRASDLTTLVDGTGMANTCTLAQGLDALTPGNYGGTLADYENSQDLGDYNPITGYSSTGRDGYVRIDLQAGQTLEVAYSQPEGDPVAYLLDSACDEVVAGADDTIVGGFETFTYAATADGPVYLTLDGWDGYMNYPGEEFGFSFTVTGP
ncbi:MAG: hypothetical protein AAGA48_36710 [Myxococcota bacterium]